MGKVAFVFSGQGAQAPGMGLDFYENSPAAKDLFDRCEAIRPGTLEQCFRGSEEELKETANTQPAWWPWSWQLWLQPGKPDWNRIWLRVSPWAN